jgi:hypothetical protein
MTCFGASVPALGSHERHTARRRHRVRQAANRRPGGCHLRRPLSIGRTTVRGGRRKSRALPHRRYCLYNLDHCGRRYRLEHSPSALAASTRGCSVHAQHAGLCHPPVLPEVKAATSSCTAPGHDPPCCRSTLNPIATLASEYRVNCPRVTRPSYHPGSMISRRALGTVDVRCMGVVLGGYAVESNRRVLLLKQCHRPAPPSRPQPQRLGLKVECYVDGTSLSARGASEERSNLTSRARFGH